MSTEEFYYTPINNKGEEKGKNIKQVISNYLHHWPLFLLFLCIFVSAGFLYLKRLNPVYQVRAKLAIMDDKNKAINDKSAALEQLNLSTGPKLVESEMEVLKSRPLVGQVVEELQLWTRYSLSTRFKRQDIYTNTPVQFKLINGNGNLPKIFFNIEILSLSKFRLTDPKERTLTVAFTDTLKNRFGTWKLVPTPNLKNYIGKTIRIDLTNQNKTVTAYQKNIGTVLNKNAPIIDLKLNDEVPERGEKILNHLIAAFKRQNIVEKQKETESTLKFIDERLDSLTGELTLAEKDVEGYKSSIGLTDISSKSQFFLDKVQTNDGMLNEVNVQLNVIDGVEEYVNKESKAENAPATIGITDPGLISLVGQLSKLQLERDKLLAITPATNPIFIPINRQIQSTKTAIKENVSGIKSSLIATKRQLNSINSQFETGIKSLPGQERKYVSIKRQQAIKESLYVYLLQKREEVALSYASTLTDAKTVEAAYFEDPESNKKIPLLISLLFGFLVPAGLISARTAMRNKILTRDDIQAVTNVPVICELSQDIKKTPIVVLNRKTHVLGEQMRALRTSILHEYKKEGRVILFTSSIAKEGKSYVSSNIGASLAIMGKKTIILELDLRKPQISKIFNLTQSQLGLSECLKGEVSKDDIIVPSGIHENLFVMRSGAVPDNPSELLEGARMRNLIEELKYEYDNILIDSPPLHLVTDAMILAPLCDITLYMVRHNFTPKSELKFVDAVYKEMKLPNMHVVFNGIEMDNRYGYSLDYGYYTDKPANSAWNFVFGKFSTRF
ncbi:capsular exopolysaccharide synthesis family protein [Pedobacter sp. CAN_A7]|uniref:GumC family protein n=1 Tax=Pedobacter sp. CAN_A7 TaxID=2787722 RepID=UPI0018C99DC3